MWKRQFGLEDGGGGDAEGSGPAGKAGCGGALGGTGRGIQERPRCPCLPPHI